MEKSSALSKILSDFEITSLNEMQQTSYQAIQNDLNVLILSPTGSGKTLAFLLPLLELLDADNKNIQCLILTPSRELALQIEQVWKKMSTGYKVNVSYGGHSKQIEIQNFSTPPALLIGTPGRIMDHIQRNSFTTSDIQILILDEFDKSLELGFQEQMQFIISKLKNIKKRILVSATSTIEIPEFTGIRTITRLDFIADDDNEKSGLTTQLIYSEDKDKIETLFNLICSLHSEAALVFCNHRAAAERTSALLNEKGIVSTYYHGGMDQDDRERALIQFRNGSINYLITTDLASRGLDIPEMKHVIHYHLPTTEEEWIHRNGRTARMHASGTAYLILHTDEKKPDYLDNSIEVAEQNGNSGLPDLPEFTTLYISGGKKNKLNKVDIVGFLIQKGNLEKEEVGRIEVKDFSSFAAVKQSKINKLLVKIKDEKIKGKKYKIEVASSKMKVKEHPSKQRKQR